MKILADHCPAENGTLIGCLQHVPFSVPDNGMGGGLKCKACCMVIVGILCHEPDLAEDKEWTYVGDGKFRIEYDELELQGLKVCFY